LLQFNSMTLPVPKADRFDAREALFRPEQAGGRILSARKQDERSLGAFALR
jgi:hypothetical protein